MTGVWPPAFGRSRSVKVVKTNTDRSATYYFLLTFHRNHGPTSYRFRDKRRFRSKTTNFFYPREFKSPAEGVLLGTGYRRLVSKTASVRLPGRERSLTISQPSGYNTQTRQTDGRTDTGRQQRRRLHIASRGKKNANQFNNSYFFSFSCLRRWLLSGWYFLAGRMPSPSASRNSVTEQTLAAQQRSFKRPFSETIRVSWYQSEFYCSSRWWTWRRQLQLLSLSLSLSLHFNGHFPVEPGLAGVYWSKGWWRWWW